MNHEGIAEIARGAFAADAAAQPAMSLRGGNDVDSYDTPTPFDEAVDLTSDEYIENHAFNALPHLDPVSWRHYLPDLIAYALVRFDRPGDLAVEGLLWSMRPPDREPPRLSSLTDDQEAAVVAFLDVLAFDQASAYQDLARQVLEEWWVPNALFRPSKRD